MDASPKLDQPQNLTDSNSHPVVRWTIYLLIAYLIGSIVTLPFAPTNLWLGEIPLLAVYQIPKIVFADWLRADVVMPFFRHMGWSYGSPSPDFAMARPYGLALAYLLPAIPLVTFIWLRTRMRSSFAKLTLILLSVATIDYFWTLHFAAQRYLTIY